MREGKSAQVIPQTCCFVHSITETQGREWAGVRGQISSRPKKETSVQPAQGVGSECKKEKGKKAVRERKKRGCSEKWINGVRERRPF